jgi:Sugar-transfer associated ATP-grasp
MKFKRIKDGISEELVPLLKTRNKKSYIRQLKEIIRLWRAHKTLPTQYLRAQLYRQDVKAIEGYLPYKILEKFQNETSRTTQVDILNDKILFARKMSRKAVPCIPTLGVIYKNQLSDDRGDPIDEEALKARAEGRPVFVKPVLGHFGGHAFRLERLHDEEIGRLKAAGEKYLVQHVVEQCPELAAFHPDSVNTIRLATWNNGSEVKLIAAALKIGHGGAQVDNVKAGGIVVPIDLSSGALSDFAKSAAQSGTEKVYRHPDTGVQFAGRTIPMWKDVVDAAIKAALVVPEVGTVGWDIAVTPAGPVIVEGNLNWGASLFQRTGIALGETVIGEPALRLWHETRRT